MKLSEFDYYLPRELIAQQPATPRDNSRLFVIRREAGWFEHRRFHDLGEYLQAGDVMVLNNSRVIPARLIGRRETGRLVRSVRSSQLDQNTADKPREAGGKVEVFLLQEIGDGAWEALLNRKVIVGEQIIIADGFSAEVVKLPTEGQKWLVKLDCGGRGFDELLEQYGQTPLPPYISPEDPSTDSGQEKIQEQYQTIYADPGKKGSVAAPTAGLHFTESLLEKLQRKGVQLEYITLHVGLGTFEPVRSENIKEHQMHAEYVEVERETVARLQKAKQEGRRIIAVGTTSVRTLEFLARQEDQDAEFRDWVNLFIYPGYEFKMIDSIITNFHLPKSTLLMLVSAFAGQELIKKAYQEAIVQKYRFYSFGDGMLIL
ncbi:tRNA preQ1(34) S-adenosylmethionine ribosyltransferase-isomerase QueA [Patescibacteria group bacterium]|nr:tRNA preQ1(34) S-adenosylmethionine ribosyltransferase-isomerase QueA [Patescibacteria group bacterium]